MTNELIALTVPGIDGSPVPISPPPGIPSGSKFTLGVLFTAGVKLAIVFGILLSLIYLAYGGFFYLQSKGDKQQLDKARRILVYAIVGLIVMSFSFVMVSVITGALGVNVLIEGTRPR